MTDEAPARDDADPQPPSAPKPKPKPARIPWRKRVFRIAIELGLVVLVYVGVTSWQERKLLGDNSDAPAFSLTALDGSRVQLRELRGKRVLLHFWATWCGVCRQEHAALNSVQAGLGKDEVLLSVVADSEDPDAVRKYVAEAGLRYPVLLADAKVVRDYRVGAFPTNYFLDKTGKIVDHTVGMSSRFGMDLRLGCAR